MKPTLETLIARAEALLGRLEAVLPRPPAAPDWQASIAFRYRKRGGVGAIEPVRHVATIRLSDLKEVEPQKERLLRNTRQFVAGRAANNVLLTGARGTGKSSLIKACLNEFAPQGLRLIEVDKTDLVDLPDIVDLVAERPERFIVYCDDLSFDEGEPGYKALKSMLDGSVAQASDNVLIYATSNRRHLLPEYMAGEPDLHPHRGRRGAPRRGGRGEDLAVGALRPVGQLLPVHAGRVPGDRRPVAAPLRHRRRGAHRGGAARGAGLGAGARLALGPRGLPVRARLSAGAEPMPAAAQRRWTWPSVC